MTFAHASDLHFGRSVCGDVAARRICEAVRSARVDVLVVTGDLTHRGRMEEFEQFREAFGPLARTGRLLVVPGNHDRLGDDVADEIQSGARVSSWLGPGLGIVRVDSTGPQNRRLVDAWGELSARDLDRIDEAVDALPDRGVRAVALHHHPLPLPEEGVSERVARLVGLRCGRELSRGRELVRRLAGRCDLLLHGHRHLPSEAIVGAGGPRPLRILGAGSTASLGWMRVFPCEGGAAGEPRWLELPHHQRPPLRLPPGLGAPITSSIA